MQGSCEEAFMVTMDAHQWALVAVVLLEDKIERLSHSLSHSHQHSGSCRHSGSHQWRSWAGSHQNKLPRVEAHQEESSRRWVQFPSLVQSREQVTIEDSPEEDVRGEEPPLLAWGDDEGTGEPSDWSWQEPRMEEEDLKCQPALNCQVQEFLAGGEVPWASDGLEDDPQQTLTTQALPPEEQWVDPLTCTACGNANVVARDLRSSQPGWHQGICPEGVGVSSGTQSEMLHLQVRE